MKPDVSLRILLPLACLALLALVPAASADHGPNPFEYARCSPGGDPTTVVGLVTTTIETVCVFTVVNGYDVVEYVFDGRDLACDIVGC